MRVMRMLAIAAGLVVAGHAAAAEPLKIRISWVTSPGSGVTLMMMKPDLSIHRGVSYTLDPTHFASTAVGLTSLAANQLDMPGLSYSAIGAAIGHAHLAYLRTIRDA